MKKRRKKRRREKRRSGSGGRKMRRRAESNPPNEVECSQASLSETLLQELKLRICSALKDALYKRCVE
jgi:hypothetical protein